MKRCPACQRPISDNKEACQSCLATIPVRTGDGVLEILNIGDGDTKITFEKNNLAESIRARRIIQDMIRRGYALIVETERNGKKEYVRALDFDPETAEYIIADFGPPDPSGMPAPIVEELSQPDALPKLAGATGENKLCQCGKPLHHKGRCPGVKVGPKHTKRLPMENTKATGIGRTAGG